MRDIIEVFRGKLHSHGIRGKELAAAANRTPQNISEVLNKKSSPSIDSFLLLIEAAERLSPGFEQDFYASLAGSNQLLSTIDNLSSSELSTVLFLCSQRLTEILNTSKNNARQLVA